MRIAITGATGNVGTAVLRRLHAEGHDLVGLARRLPEPAGPSGPSEDAEDADEGVDGTAAVLDDVEWVAVDLTDDACLPELRRAFTGADAVVHLAWGFQPSHRLDLLEELGVGGTRRVLEAVTDTGVAHLVHMSSVGTYATKKDDRRVDESWSTAGVPTSPYSRHKAMAERLLDEHQAAHPDLRLARLRPGIIGQGSAGSALLRYGVPAVVPAALVRLLPLLPLDRSLRLPVVHSDDVAAAVAAVLDTGAVGPFNLAAEPVLTADHVAAALGARAVHVPAPVVRAAVALAWHARVEQLDPGWIDLAYAIPLMDTSRARRELGWEPEHDAVATLQAVVDGLASARSAPTPVLRPRHVVGELVNAVTRGSVARRRRP